MAYLEPQRNAIEALQEIRPQEITFGEFDDITALKIVVQDVTAAESAQSKAALQTRWDQHDTLYEFVVPQRNWPGTLTERSSLGVPLCLEHQNSITPQIFGGLLADDPPFMARPAGNTTMDAARAVQKIQGWELKQANFVDELKLGAFEMFEHGTGVWKWGWRKYDLKRRVYEEIPRQIDALAGVDIPAQLTSKIVTIKRSCPTFEWVRLKNLFIDPTLQIPDIRQAKWVAHHFFLTLAQLDDLRGQPGYTIPSREELIAAATHPKEPTVTSPSDDRAALFNRDWEAKPSEPASADPLSQPMEVIEYQTPKRQIAIIQRKFVMENKKNEFGRITYLSAPYIRRPNQFYSFGIPDLIGNEQRLQQGVLNARLDRLALTVHPMWMRIRGMSPFPQPIRTRPGLTLDMDHDGDIRPIQPPAVDQSVYAEIQESDARAQRRTAANELVVQGSIGEGRSSITRTATGVQSVTSASGARLGDVIEGIARQVFVPFLEALHEFNPEYLGAEIINSLLDDELKGALVGEDGKPYTVPTIDILNARCEFDMLASTKLQARTAMSQMFPLLTQNLFAEPVLEALRGQNKKIDYAEFISMLFDVTAWPNKNSLIVNMSEEEIAERQSESPMMQLMQQQQQDRIQREGKISEIEAADFGRSGRDIVKSKLREEENAQQSRLRSQEEKAKMDMMRQP